MKNRSYDNDCVQAKHVLCPTDEASGCGIVLEYYIDIIVLLQVCFRVTKQSGCGIILEHCKFTHRELTFSTN